MRCRSNWATDTNTQCWIVCFQDNSSSQKQKQKQSHIFRICLKASTTHECLHSALQSLQWPAGKVVTKGLDRGEGKERVQGREEWGVRGDKIANWLCAKWWDPCTSHLPTCPLAHLPTCLLTYLHTNGSAKNVDKRWIGARSMDISGQSWCTPDCAQNVRSTCTQDCQLTLHIFCTNTSVPGLSVVQFI